jgi:hypothetical protein
MISLPFLSPYCGSWNALRLKGDEKALIMIKQNDRRHAEAAARRLA